MIKLIDRYIVKELLGPFLFGMAAFSFILAGSTVLFDLINQAIKYHIPTSIVLQLFIYRLPFLIAFTFPMAMLLGTIIAVGRMSADLEIMAFRASGIPFQRLVIPIVVVGLSISLITIWFNESVVPQASYSAELLIRSYREKDTPKITKNLNFTEYAADNLPNRIINVLEIENGLMKNITVAEFENGILARLIRADSGRWLKTGGWEFFSGVMHTFPASEKKRSFVIEFDREFINIKVNPLDLTKKEKHANEMTAAELQERIELHRKIGKDPIEDIVNYHLKFSVPFASFIFSILGASVAIRPHRSSSAFGLGISLIVILIYYVLTAVSTGLGLSHTIPPALAAWLPNIIVGTFSLYMLRRIGAS